MEKIEVWMDPEGGESDPIRVAFYGSAHLERVEIECMYEHSSQIVKIDKTRALNTMRELGKRFRDHFYGRITKIEIIEEGHPNTNFVICLEGGQLEIGLLAVANRVNRFVEGDCILIEFDLEVVGDTIGHHVNCMRNGQVYREFWIDDRNLVKE